nr:MAG TPA: hypothetical protein [Caudoviricetes sp.]
MEKTILERSRKMAASVQITAIICLTIIILCWRSR